MVRLLLGGKVTVKHCKYDIQNSETLTASIRHTIDVNVQNSNGKTPLHVSCESGEFDKTMLLSEHGALATVKDNNGEYALEILSEKNTFLFSKIVGSCSLNPNENIELIIEAYELAALKNNQPYFNRFECMLKATALRVKHNIPKCIQEPMQCYGFQKEWETLEELEEYKDDAKQLILQAILAKERIHKGNMKKLMELIDKDLIPGKLHKAF